MQMFYIHSFSLIEFLNLSKVFLFVFKSKQTKLKEKRKICLIPSYSCSFIHRTKKKQFQYYTSVNRLCAFHHFILFRLIPHFWIMVRLVDYECALDIPLYTHIYIVLSTLTVTNPYNLENILKINFEEKVFFFTPLWHYPIWMNNEW